MTILDVPLSVKMDAVNIPQDVRPHLGGSQIGHNCNAYLYYTFHWAYDRDIDSRINRIFRLGDAIENLIIADLERLNMPVTGTQKKVIGYKRHAGGSIDGIVNGMLFEAKSMNNSNFNKVKSKGVEEAFPVYYAQMQYYMGYLELTEGLFVSMNKNDQRCYTEMIPFVQSEFSRLQLQEITIIDATEVPDKISRYSNWHECKYCSAKEVCHHGQAPNKNCRTCTWGTVEDLGVWKCGKHEVPLTFKAQQEGCPDYTRSF